MRDVVVFAWVFALVFVAASALTCGMSWKTRWIVNGIAVLLVLAAVHFLLPPAPV